MRPTFVGNPRYRKFLICLGTSVCVACSCQALASWEATRRQDVERLAQVPTSCWMNIDPPYDLPDLVPEIKFKMLGPLGPFGWVPWAHLDPFGPIWVHLDPLGPLGPFGPIGPICAHLWPFGAIWAHLGPLGPLGPFGSIWVHWAYLGTSNNRLKLTLPQNSKPSRNIIIYSVL